MPWVRSCFWFALDPPEIEQLMHLASTFLRTLSLSLSSTRPAVEFGTPRRKPSPITEPVFLRTKTLLNVNNFVVFEIEIELIIMLGGLFVIA